MAESNRVVLCAPCRRACAGGLRRIGACLPVLICPIIILVMGRIVPPPGYRWLLYGLASVLALPALSWALALLHTLCWDASLGSTMR